jgi:hypothetical protein
MATTKRKGGETKPRKTRSLTIRVLDALRQKLEEAAQASGRSVSEEAAYRMMLSFQLASELRDHSEIVKSVDAELQGIMVRRGWGKIIDPRYGGAVFIPPGHNIPQSGFITPQEAAAPQPAFGLPPALREAIREEIRAALAEATPERRRRA